LRTTGATCPAPATRPPGGVAAWRRGLVAWWRCRLAGVLVADSPGADVPRWRSKGRYPPPPPSRHHHPATTIPPPPSRHRSHASRSHGRRSHGRGTGHTVQASWPDIRTRPTSPHSSRAVPISPDIESRRSHEDRARVLLPLGRLWCLWLRRCWLPALLCYSRRPVHPIPGRIRLGFTRSGDSTADRDLPATPPRYRDLRPRKGFTANLWTTRRKPVENYFGGAVPTLARISSLASQSWRA
jgi:hypothetical protein